MIPVHRRLPLLNRHSLDDSHGATKILRFSGFLARQVAARMKRDNAFLNHRGSGFSREFSACRLQFFPQTFLDQFARKPDFFPASKIFMKVCCCKESLE